MKERILSVASGQSRITGFGEITVSILLILSSWSLTKTTVEATVAFKSTAIR